jgi:hypothetical protein
MGCVSFRVSACSFPGVGKAKRLNLQGAPTPLRAPQVGGRHGQNSGKHLKGLMPLGYCMRCINGICILSQRLQPPWLTSKRNSRTGMKSCHACLLILRDKYRCTQREFRRIE